MIAPSTVPLLFTVGTSTHRSPFKRASSSNATPSSRMRSSSAKRSSIVSSVGSFSCSAQQQQETRRDAIIVLPYRISIEHDCRSLNQPYLACSIVRPSWFVPSRLLSTTRVTIPRVLLWWNPAVFGDSKLEGAYPVIRVRAYSLHYVALLSTSQKYYCNARSRRNTVRRCDFILQNSTFRISPI